MVPNFILLLNFLDNDSEKREKEKSKLMKVCLNCTRSAVKNIILINVDKGNNVKFTKDNGTSSGISENNDDSESDDWNKIIAAVDSRKKAFNENVQHSSTKQGSMFRTSDWSESESLL